MKKLIATMLCATVWANQASSEDKPNIFDQFDILTYEEIKDKLPWWYQDKVTTADDLVDYTQSGSFFTLVESIAPRDSYGPSKSNQEKSLYTFDTLENCNNALLKEASYSGVDWDMKIMGSGSIVIFAPDIKPDSVYTAHCMEVSFSGLPYKNGNLTGVNSGD